MLYAIHIPGLVIFQFWQLSKKQSMLDELEIHISSMAFQDNYWIALKRHDLLSDRKYKVYSLYIPCIYYAYTMWWSLASPPTRSQSLSKMLCWVQNEMFTFEIDSENALVGCTLEHWRPGVELVKEIGNFRRLKMNENSPGGHLPSVPFLKLPNPNAKCAQECRAQRACPLSKSCQTSQ